MRPVLLPMRSSSQTSEALFGRKPLSQHAYELRTEGHDAVAVLEVGLSGATDERVLRFAVENGRVLVTLDADFANVMRFPPERTLGVVRLKVHPATEERIRQAIRRALLFLQDIDITGRLAVVDEDKIRIRG
jgi:predicted nuclease of predicted toxin-antitoxin system